jgi:hypothetical protein
MPDYCTHCDSQLTGEIMSTLTIIRHGSGFFPGFIETCPTCGNQEVLPRNPPIYYATCAEAKVAPV